MEFKKSGIVEERFFRELKATQLFQKHEVALTPAFYTLFEKGRGLLLNDGDRELFHSVVVKELFVSYCNSCTRARYSYDYWS